MAEHADPEMVSGSEILRGSLRPDREYAVKVYDFKRPDKFSREQIRTVHVIHETISRLCAPVLSGIVGKPVDVRCAGVDQLAFYEFFPSTSDFSALIPVSVPPLKGGMLMRLDGSLASLLVRRACGARLKDGAELAPPDHSLTDMECVVMRDIADGIMPIIDEAWRTVVPLSSSVTDIATDPQHVQIVPPTEMIVLGSLEVTIGGSSAFINFAIPYLTIEPIISRLSAMYWYSTTRMGPGPRVSSRAASVPVDVELSAAAPPVRLSELPAIISGAPLELPGLAEGRLTLAAGSVPVAELAAEPSLLSGEAPLAAKVVSCRPGAAEPGSAPDGAGASLSAAVTSAIDGLAKSVRDVKSAVEEMRDDRETLAAELGDPAGALFAKAREANIERRHHRDIALALTGEAPATIGFVLAGLTPEMAATVLADLDAARQPEVMRCIATLTDGDRDLHRKLLAFIGRRITRSRETTTSGGPDLVAEILNITPRSVEKHVMETFMRDDKAFFEQIARRMFVFEDFVLVDATAIRKLAARVDVEELALALKGMPAEVTRHIMEAVDDQTAEALDAAVDRLGRVRRRDVESAQRDMIEELRQLEAAGEVVVARPDEVIE